MIEAWLVFAVSTLASGAVLIGMWLAARRYRPVRDAVTVRVHVAGTRGKTTTARLIGAGLAASGRRVVVKTTGTDPLVVLPDGAVVAWPRGGPASISELGRFFRLARGVGADAAVIESMAIEPEYLWASERYLVRATHLVVTNLRPDHAEVLPTDAKAAARAVAELVPAGGRVFVTEEAAEPALIEACGAAGASVERVTTEGLASEAANRRLALIVCGALGVAPEAAREAMAVALPDPGKFFLAEVEGPWGRCRFASAFACNDTVSFAALWAEHRPAGAPVVLLNARADRPLRTRAFLNLLATLDPPVRLVISGAAPLRWARAAGFPDARTARLRARSAAGAIEELAAAAGPEGTVWGAANYAGIGAAIVRHLRRAGRC